jgi:hypothetical protein
MSLGLRRGIAALAGRALQRALPRSSQPWGWAIRFEIDAIRDDGEALRFALRSFAGLLPHAAASHLAQVFAPSRRDPFHPGGSNDMRVQDIARRPRALGIACAVGAVVLGLVYLAMAGAPVRYLVINAGALATGVTLLALLGTGRRSGEGWQVGMIVAAAGALLATAMFGATVEGAARWVTLGGGLSVQPSLVLLPAMLLAFARRRHMLVTAAIIAAAAALAIQPDRAMAAMLVAGLAVLLAQRPDRHVAIALGASAIGLMTTLARADTLPAVPYVDQILYSSFDVHALAGVAVLAGSALLLLPAIMAGGRDPADRATYAMFSALWLSAILASALDNYPTPVVGYGGSAILGYLLSLLELPEAAGVRTGAAAGRRADADGMPSDVPLSLRPA